MSTRVQKLKRSSEAQRHSDAYKSSEAIWLKSLGSATGLEYSRFVMGTSINPSNLLRRGVLESTAQTHCACCSAEIESEDHLFTRCEVAVWLEIHSWLGINTTVPGNTSLSFQAFVAPFKSKKRLDGLNLIWKTMMWIVAC
ncbi:hypothetical protein TSUD_154440 [Trifolium subterraneum]|uniref:Reverse transcriptase zinc-binding domain-containing protein n=1 Tax=Trifolium subterraneum TaxID=3900 RepID=A0A2Z6PB66_TRISU|nr:hypothetical protein TSUD_154440 [Trifolium subterraneum]